MYKNSMFIFLCLIVSQTTFAQKNWVSAQIVYHNGDTTTGEINDQEWLMTPETIDFQDKKNSSLTIPVQEIQQLEIQGEKQEFYFGYNMDISVFGQKELSIPRSSKVIYKNKNILLRALVLGTVDLLHYHNEFGGDQYFVRKGNEIKELIAFEYFQTNNNLQKFRHEAYKNQLLRFLFDCPASQEEILNKKFSAKWLKKLIIQYNQCGENSGANYIEKKEKIITRFGVKGGAVYINAKRKETNESLNKIVPKIGLIVEFQIPRNRFRNAYFLEVFYSPFQIGNTTNAIRSTKALDLNFGFKKRWLFNSIEPTIHFGSRITQQFGKRQNDRIFLTPEISFFAGVGINKESFSLDLRYDNEDFKYILFDNKPTIYLIQNISLLGTYHF